MTTRHETDDGMRSTAAVLWPEGDADGPRRGRPARLSASTIVEAAIAVADADGLDAVSMQRIAEALGFTKMALYRHFSAKPDLLAAMLDHAFGSPAPIEPGTWREQVREWTLGLSSVLGDHPWACDISRGVRIYGPNEIAWTEAGLAALDGAPLDELDKLDTLGLLGEHVKGVHLQSRPSLPDLVAIGSSMESILETHGADYPRTRVAFRHVSGLGDRLDRTLEFGVDRILDGIEAFAARGAPS